MDLERPLLIASELLKRAGLDEKTQSLLPVSGGANNRVFKVIGKNRNYLMKCYFRHRNDPRNRCKTDFEFTRFAWESGVHSVPEPLAVSWEHHAGLYEFVNGRRITTNEITTQIINQAADLFGNLNLNRSSQNAKSIPLASESCFSIREHLICVERRVNRLQTIDESQPLGNQAALLIHEQLVPALKRILDEITKSKLDLECKLSATDQCLSPSDFGFHNALIQTDGMIRFFDFEYAGWDDPAKMICDFFCQPEIPIPSNAYTPFTQLALAPFSSQTNILQRAELLIPLYRLKWCCIMLNEFISSDSSRRFFSNPKEDALRRKRNQLAKAEHSLQQMR